ncbi:MAG TPA: MarR family transcriptional regulator [Galbitalea sp.]|jgi:DNA-binding MarR family transcriptional regulator|nr:MarR family transcriptional regulator [Galbitalea sp.]
MRIADVPATREQRGARRSPTKDELATWRDFVETSELVRGVIGSRLQAESGLSTGDYAVLLSLSEAQGSRVRSSELASRIGWQRSRLSHHLGRMEQRGLIRRENCATDSRGAEAVLTPAGADAFRRASAPHMHAIHDLFASALRVDQLTSLREITQTLREQVESSVRERS